MVWAELVLSRISAVWLPGGVRRRPGGARANKKPPARGGFGFLAFLPFLPAAGTYQVKSSGIW